MKNIPDKASHVTGWEARFIDGRWCVGMRGNLDTIHDAVLTINSGTSGGVDEARKVAEWIVEQYNTAMVQDNDPQLTAQPRGIGRSADDKRYLWVAFDRIPTDDDIRAVHEILRTASLK